MAIAQRSCLEVAALATHPSLRVASAELGGHQSICNFSTGWPCPFLPPAVNGVVTRRPEAAAQPIPVPARRLLHLHADLEGPHSCSSEGFNHLLTVIDRSLWCLAEPPPRRWATHSSPSTPSHRGGALQGGQQGGPNSGKSTLRAPFFNFRRGASTSSRGFHGLRAAWRHTTASAAHLLGPLSHGLQGPQIFFFSSTSSRTG